MDRKAPRVGSEPATAPFSYAINIAGLSVAFPRQLYSRAYVRKFIRDNRDNMKPGEIARRVGLTERRVRQIIHDMKEEG